MNFISKIINTKRRLLCCLLFFAIACNSKNTHDKSISISKDSIAEENKINEALNSLYRCKKLVKQGDLILRTGKDFTSETFRKLSQNDQTYSHCGIASIEHDSVFVYHAIGGEWNPTQKLRRDPFEMFCNPFESRGFGIYRYELTGKENTKLLKIVHALFSRGIMFDMQFDLSSDDKMYCSEFVYKAIEEATENNIALPVTTLNRIKFVTIDNLFINPSCMEIRRVVFMK